METKETLRGLIKISTRWLRIIFPVIVMILLLVLFDFISKYRTVIVVLNTLAPFVFSFLLAWILNPIVNKIANRLKCPRVVSTLITIILLIVILTGMFLIIIPEMIYQIKVLIKYVPNVEPAFREIISNIEPFLGGKVDITIFDKLIENVSNIFESIISGSFDVITSSISFVGSVISSIFIALMVVMAGIYILLDFDNISKKTHSLVPKRFKDDFDFLSDEVNRVIVGYLRGLIIETVLMIILSYISFYVAFQFFGAKGALVFACIIGLTNVVPYIGPYIGAIPVSIYALTISFKLFIIVAIVVVVVQQIDGIIIKPKVFGKTTDVHPALSIISIILFANLYGIFGVIFAIPITGLVIVAIKFTYNKLLIKYPDKLK